MGRLLLLAAIVAGEVVYFRALFVGFLRILVVLLIIVTALIGSARGHKTNSK